MWPFRVGTPRPPPLSPTTHTHKKPGLNQDMRDQHALSYSILIAGDINVPLINW